MWGDQGIKAPAPQPVRRSPLDQLGADVHDLAGNLLVPPNIRNTLRLAVQVLADQEARIKALEVTRHG